MEIEYEIQNGFNNTLDLTSKNQVKKTINGIFDDVVRLQFETADFNNEASLDEGNEYILASPVDTITGINGPIRTVRQSNALLTSPAQLASWSWLIQPQLNPNEDVKLISKSQSNLDFTIRSNFDPSTPIGGDGDIPPNDPRLTQVDPVIGINKYTLNCKITGPQYRLLSQNKNGYIVFDYKGVEYKGYIESVSLCVGTNELSEVVLIQKYE